MYERFCLGTINGPWKCESNVSLQPEALEKAKANASQSTEQVNNEKQQISKNKLSIVGLNMRNNSNRLKSD